MISSEEKIGSGRDKNHIGAKGHVDNDIHTKVEPRGLALQPFIENVLHPYKLFFPDFNLSLERLDEGGTPDGLCFDDVVIQ